MARNNKWEGDGRLGRDPELKVYDSGFEVCSFSIAVSRGKKEDGKPPVWLEVKVLGDNAAEVAGRWSKGDHVKIVGRIDTFSWENDQGENRTKYEIVADAVTEFVWDKGGNSRKRQADPVRDQRPDEEPF